MSERVYTDYTDEAQAQGLANAMLFTGEANTSEAYEDVMAAAHFLERHTDDEILFKHNEAGEQVFHKILDARTASPPMDINIDAVRKNFTGLVKAWHEEDDGALQTLKEELGLNSKHWNDMLKNLEYVVWPSIDRRDYDLAAQAALRRQAPDVEYIEEAATNYAQELALQDLIRARSDKSLQAEREVREAAIELAKIDRAILCLPHVDTIRAAKIYNRALGGAALEPLAFVAGLRGFLYESLKDTQVLLSQALHSPSVEIHEAAVGVIREAVDNANDYPSDEVREFLGIIASKIEETEIDE